MLLGAKSAYLTCKVHINCCYFVDGCKEQSAGGIEYSVQAQAVRLMRKSRDTTFCQQHKEYLLQVCEYLNTFIVLGLGGRGISTGCDNEITN